MISFYKKKSLRILVTALACFVILVLYINYEPRSSINYEPRSSIFVIDDLINTTNYSNRCKHPFKISDTQYYIKIENIVYPRHVPKMYNQTINYKCLNKNKKRNRILLWTKFIGSDDFFYGKYFFSLFEKIKTNCKKINKFIEFLCILERIICFRILVLELFRN